MMLAHDTLMEINRTSKKTISQPREIILGTFTMNQLSKYRIFNYKNFA